MILWQLNLIILKAVKSMKIINSAQNPTFKILKSLKTSKGIKKEKLFLAAGQYVIHEVKQSGTNFKSIHFLKKENPDYLLNKELFQELSTLNSKLPIYLLKTPKLKLFDFKKEPKGIEVILPIGDPKNLGALIRTCLAFSVKKIILLKEASSPFLQDVIKASSGSILKAPLFLGPSIKDLTHENFYSLDKSGVSIKTCDLKGKSLRLLLGEEGGHIPKELSKNFLSIPISSHVESLNVNSCLSIALYELSI